MRWSSAKRSVSISSFGQPMRRVPPSVGPVQPGTVRRECHTVPRRIPAAADRIGCPASKKHQFRLRALWPVPC
jgi:hypothetical protein